MSAKNKILVTGGAGYIGSHTVVELIRAGFIPIILDDFSNADPNILQEIESLTGQKIATEIGSCLNAQFLINVFEKHQPNGIIHFAAFKAVGESVEKPLDYYQNNLVGLIEILKCCVKFDVHSFVFSSSCTVYGNPENCAIVSEESELKPPTSPYGWTKFMGEQIIRDTASAHPNFKPVLLRYFNPIGAHESGRIGELPTGIPNNIMPFMTQTAVGLREHLTVFGNDYPTPDGTCIRDYIHVCDLAEAHVAALTLDAHEQVEVFNVGTGKGTSVLELIRAFEDVTEQPLNWKIGPRRSGDVVEIYANPERIQEKLKWNAKRSIQDAVRDALKWENYRLSQIHKK